MDCSKWKRNSDRFQDHEIGMISIMTKHLLVPNAKTKPIVSLGSVWAFIHPAIPDTLHEVGSGLYEARWWKPVPSMDIEILKRTDGVIFEGSPFEPENLCGGIAIQFRLFER